MSEKEFATQPFPIGNNRRQITNFVLSSFARVAIKSLKMKLFGIFVTLFCLLSFLYYFYDIAIDYFNYRTITSVNYQPLPPFVYTLIVSYHETAFNGSAKKFFEDRLKTNSQRPQFGRMKAKEPDLMRYVGYRIRFKNLSDSDEDKIFVLSSFSSNVPLSPTEIYSNPYPLKPTIFVRSDTEKVMEVAMSPLSNQNLVGCSATMVTLLEYPYDTDCIHRRNSNGTTVSRRECERACGWQNDKCTAACGKRACVHYSNSLQYTSIKFPVRTSSFAVGILNKFNLRMDSVPTVSTTMYVFYSLGLLSTFAEFSILFMFNQTGKLFSSCLLEISSLPFTRILNYRSIVITICSALCAFHVYYVTNDYLNYDHESQTYIGGPIKVDLPQFFICHELKVSEIVHDSIGNISFPFTKSLDTKITSFEKEHFETKFRNCSRIMTPNMSLTAESMSTTDQIIEMKFNPSRNLIRPLIKFYALNEGVPREDVETGFLIGTIKSKGFEIATSFTSTTLLKSPYSTNCINYEMITGEYSRFDCLEMCEKITRNETECNKNVCKPNCHSVQWYSVSYASAMNAAIINFPEYVRYITLVPRISTVDFAAGILSVLSFWTGICVFTTIIDIVGYILKIIRDFKFNPILYLLIIIGLGFHSFVMISNYLEYKMVSNVNYQIPDSTPYPKLTIIADNYLARSNDSLLLGSPKEVGALFVPTKDLIYEIEIASPNSDENKILNETERKLFIETCIEEYIYGDDKLISIDFGKYFKNDNFFKFRDRSSQLLYRILVDNELPEELSRYLWSNQLHYGDIALYDKFKSVSTINARSFSQMHTKLLRAPFPTNCIDYGDVYKVDKSWLKCLKSQYSETLPNDLVLPTTETMKRHIPTDEDARKRMQCIKRFRSRSPCSSHVMKYGPYPKAKLELAAKPSDQVIRIFFTSSLTCALYPKTTLTQLLIILGGVIGTWSGINLFTLLIGLPKVTKRFFRKRLQNLLAVDAVGIRSPKVGLTFVATEIIFKQMREQKEDQIQDRISFGNAQFIRQLDHCHNYHCLHRFNSSSVSIFC